MKLKKLKKRALRASIEASNRRALTDEKLDALMEGAMDALASLVSSNAPKHGEGCNCEGCSDCNKKFSVEKVNSIFSDSGDQYVSLSDLGSLLCEIEAYVPFERRWFELSKHLDNISKEGAAINEGA